MCPSVQVARTGKDAVLGYGVLRWTGRRAWHESVPSQDAALVFQGVLPGFACAANRRDRSRSISADSIKHLNKSECKANRYYVIPNLYWRASR